MKCTGRFLIGIRIVLDFLSFRENYISIENLKKKILYLAAVLFESDFQWNPARANTSDFLGREKIQKKTQIFANDGSETIHV